MELIEELALELPALATSALVSDFVAAAGVEGSEMAAAAVEVAAEMLGQGRGGEEEDEDPEVGDGAGDSDGEVDNEGDRAAAAVGGAVGAGIARAVEGGSTTTAAMASSKATGGSGLAPSGAEDILDLVLEALVRVRGIFTPYVRWV